MRFNKASKALVLCDFRTSAQHIAPSPVGVCRIDWVAHFWQLFEDLYVEPAVGKTNSSLWRHNKDTGVVTQFIRGIGCSSALFGTRGENGHTRLTLKEDHDRLS